MEWYGYLLWSLWFCGLIAVDWYFIAREERRGNLRFRWIRVFVFIGYTVGATAIGYLYGKTEMLLIATWLVIFTIYAFKTEKFRIGLR